MKAGLHAAALAALLITPLAAPAQTAWRCGNTYSQTPCPAGTAVQVDDHRTTGQKKQTDDAAARDAKIADTMEKARQKQEALAPRALIFPTHAAVKEKPAVKPKAHKKTAKKAEQENFTATDGKVKAKEKPAKKKKAD